LTGQGARLLRLQRRRLQALPRRSAFWPRALGVLFVSVVFLPRGMLGWLLRLPLPAHLER
jgi:hypothetical protein